MSQDGISVRVTFFNVSPACSMVLALASELLPWKTGPRDILMVRRLSHATVMGRLGHTTYPAMQR